MLHHHGFACWISSEDKKLPLYSEEANGNTKSAWIPSEVGKAFSVSWQDMSGKRISSSGHVFIDGKDVASAIIRPGRTTPVERSGAKQGPYKTKPFTFANLTLTDNDELADPADNRIKDVGTVRVEIKRVKLGNEVPFDGYEVPEHELVHERAKKAGAHCTKFGEAKRTNGSHILKANGIMEKHRKRVNEINDDVIDIDSSDEERSAVPRTEPETPSRKRVKREPTPNDSSLPHPRILFSQENASPTREPLAGSTLAVISDGLRGDADQLNLRHAVPKESSIGDEAKPAVDEERQDVIQQDVIQTREGGSKTANRDLFLPSVSQEPSQESENTNDQLTNTTSEDDQLAKQGNVKVDMKAHDQSQDMTQTTLPEKSLDSGSLGLDLKTGDQDGKTLSPSPGAQNSFEDDEEEVDMLDEDGDETSSQYALPLDVPPPSSSPEPEHSTMDDDE